MLTFAPINGPHVEGFGFVSDSKQLQAAVARSLRFLSGNTGVKGSEYTIIPGGSHATPAENHEMINFRIVLWLRTCFHELREEHAGTRVRFEEETGVEATAGRGSERTCGRARF